MSQVERMLSVVPQSPARAEPIKPKRLHPNLVRLTVLTAEQVVREWEVIARMLALSLPYSSNRMSIEQMRESIEKGEAIVIIAWAPEERQIFAAFLCDVTIHPSGVRAFSIGYAGGTDLGAWAHLWPAFEEVARAYGCDQLEVVGRRGWGKFIDAQEVATHYVKWLRRGEQDVTAEE